MGRKEPQLQNANSQLVELYVALRRSGKDRINAGQLLGWKSKWFHSAAVKQTVLMVPKAGKKQVFSDRVAAYAVDATEFEDDIGEADVRANFFLLDPAVRELGIPLGIGVRELEIKAGMRRDKEQATR